MVKKDLPPILKGPSEKPTIHCPHYFTQISHIEVTEERHGVVNKGGEIEYDLNAENNGAPRYFCPQCQEEIEEVNLTRSRANRVGIMENMTPFCQ